jgi:hypothetical protein
LLGTLLPVGSGVGVSASKSSGESVGEPDQVSHTVAEFERNLTYLRGLPLGSGEIGALLIAADRAWQTLLAGARDPNTAPGRLALAAGSEDLLALFDELTSAYERSMQVLIG